MLNSAKRQPRKLDSPKPHTRQRAGFGAYSACLIMPDTGVVALSKQRSLGFSSSLTWKTCNCMTWRKRKGVVVNNPNCDGSGPHTTQQVRVLPTGGDSNGILCRGCFNREISFRKERNRELSKDCQFKLPTWESLRVYGAD